MRVAGCLSRLVEEEEVRRCEVEGKMSHFCCSIELVHKPFLSPVHLEDHRYSTVLLQRRFGAA